MYCPMAPATPKLKQALLFNMFMGVVGMNKAIGDTAAIKKSYWFL